MKIALIGTRGVPASYGGFETCVEEIGKRLVQRGHEVTVYCRTSYYKERREKYQGMKLVYLPNLQKKSLDTLSHTMFSVLHASRKSYDILMVFNAANSPALILPRMLGNKIAINTDGLEWKRGKWGPVARRYYKMSEWLSTRLANRIVSDSPGIQSYYRDTYGAESSYIAYGAQLNNSRKPDLLKQLGLEPGGYFLQVTRFEPENNPLLTIQAFKRLKTDKKLVLVGDVPYATEYSNAVKAESSDRVILPGFLYERDLLNEIWCNCYAYVHGNEVGGTNPALLQTMANGCFTIAIDVSFSHDVLKDCGVFYRPQPEELARRMQWALDNPDVLSSFKRKAKTRVVQEYNWDRVTEGYEDLFAELVAGKYPWRLRG